MIADLIRKAADGLDLTSEEAKAGMTEIMSGQASPVQIASFLVAMRMKGETSEEVTEFARVMRQHVRSVSPRARPLVDTCGTGGDAIKTFNVSTCAALVAAGAGVAIAKHGNRSVTSKCGSADVLEALGIRFDLSPVRRELGLRTMFNMLGPLTNPAGADAQVLGVYSPELTELHASVLRNLGSQRAYVVHGVGGLDELSTFGETRVTELKEGEMRTYNVKPEDFGLERAAPEDLQGRTPEANAQLLVDILGGKEGPARDIVLLNTAAAIAAGGKADTLSEGLAVAADSVTSGAARSKLEALQAF